MAVPPISSKEKNSLKTCYFWPKNWAEVDISNHIDINCTLVALVARQGKIFEREKKHITGSNVYPQFFAAPLQEDLEPIWKKIQEQIWLIQTVIGFLPKYAFSIVLCEFS